MVNYQTPRYKLFNVIFNMSRLGVFKYIRDILQVTVLIYHPVLLLQLLLLLLLLLLQLVLLLIGQCPLTQKNSYTTFIIFILSQWAVKHKNKVNHGVESSKVAELAWKGSSPMGLPYLFVVVCLILLRTDNYYNHLSFFVCSKDVYILLNFNFDCINPNWF